jgi:transcriptional regulator with XRE-family HTH domain
MQAPSVLTVTSWVPKLEKLVPTEHISDILVMVTSTDTSGFGRRLLTLRKQKGWSQPELGKKAGTSGAIIGRYERSEITPSIEVASKLANAFGVTLDYLVDSQEGLPDILRDQRMLGRWQAIDALESDEQERILSVLDSLVRDAQARRAYKLSA